MDGWPSRETPLTEALGLIRAVEVADSGNRTSSTETRRGRPGNIIAHISMAFDE